MEALVKKLSGWTRIGIVASVVWAVGSFVWFGTLHNKEWIDQLWDARAHCMLHPDHTMTREQCDTEYMEIINREVQHRWEEAAILAVVPIPFGWLLIGGLFRVARWVRAGFAGQ
jgi:hypothetical protein